MKHLITALFYFLSASVGFLQTDNKNMEAFQRYLTRNIKETNLIPVDGKNEYYRQIEIGKSKYYYQTVIGDSGCNGSFCIMQHYDIYNTQFSDSTYLWSWGYMGFFTDINKDSWLDFIHISETNKNIYSEDTFKVSILSVKKEDLDFEPLRDSKGKEYFITIYWREGLFGENSNQQPVKIIEQHWPFYVKF